VGPAAAASGVEQSSGKLKGERARVYFPAVSIASAAMNVGEGELLGSKGVGPAAASAAMSVVGEGELLGSKGVGSPAVKGVEHSPGAIKGGRTRSSSPTVSNS